MLLYVMRHGPAEDVSSTGRDFDRALTGAGRELVRQMAGALGDRGRAPGRIVSSPLRRARETAEIVRDALCPGVGIDLDEALGLGGALPFPLVERLTASGADALLVSHQPMVSELVQALVPGAGHLASFRTATIVGLTPGGGGTPTSGALRLAFVLDPHRG